jgi:hypothetical protein
MTNADSMTVVMVHSRDRLFRPRQLPLPWDHLSDNLRWFPNFFHSATEWRRAQQQTRGVQNFTNVDAARLPHPFKTRS